MKRVKIIVFLFVPFVLLAEDTRIGFQSHLTTYGISPSLLDLEIIETMANAGMTWTRHWIVWYQVESDSGVYNFTHQDSIINSYTRNGVNVYVTLMGGNIFYDHDSVDHSAFSRPELGLAPTPGSASLDGWLNFVDTLVKRYRDRVHYWAIWNEPNLEEFWRYNPNPDDYAYLVKVTSERIKSIDPTAQIIGGNLSMIDFPFFSQIVDSIIPYIDYIGYHPYRNFPEDDQQNLLPWGTFPAEDSLYSFEEEMDVFLDSIRLHDPEGRVGLWDDESGYPSNPEPQLFTSNPANTEITQTKYLLRKYLLSLAYNARVSIWWWSFDVVSNAFNVFSDTWFTHFYDLTPEDWQEKGGGFFFNYIGLTYTPYYGIIVKEAEDADTLKGAWQNEGTYISVPDSIAPLDTLNVACYSIPISPFGKYTIWIRFRNPDTLKQPGCVALVDSFVAPYSPYYAYVSPYPSDTAFEWILAGDAELLENDIYWYQGPHYFNLTNDTLKLFIVPFFGGTQIDKIYLNQEGNVSVKKNAINVTGNIASLFNENVMCDTSISVGVTNIDVDSADYAALRKFAYRDTVTSQGFLAYWLGVASDDSYPTSYMDLWVAEPLVDSVVLFDLMTSAQSNLTYRTSGDTIFIDSLPVSDAPNVLILAKEGSGIEDKTPIDVSPYLLSNPVINEAVFSFSITGSTSIELQVIDVAGRLVGRKTEQYKSNGRQLLRYNTNHLSQGVYFWRIKSESQEWKGKFILLGLD